MRKFLLPLVALTLATTMSIAQSKKDCKFTTIKLTNGNTLQMVKVSSKIGYFLIGKSGGKIALSYNTNAFINMFNPSDNIISLRIDSVQFVFTDQTALVLKPMAGSGQVANNSTVLKPQIRNLNYTINYLPNGKEDAVFKQKKLTLFRVFAEKEAQYGDLFNEKQQNQFINAFNCLAD